MKKWIVFILAAVMCLTLTACGQAEEPVEVTVEDAYAQLVACATEGQYLEGWRVAQSMPEVKQHQDGQAYLDYCQAMRAYEAGGLGEAYELLKDIPSILDAKTVSNEIAERVRSLEGHYVADNGKGSFLHIVIQDGKVATGLVGRTDDDQTFHYTDKDFTSDIVVSKYTDGTEFFAIGRYSSIGAEVTVNYVITTFDDSSDLMVLKFEDYEYDTFNGLYSKYLEPYTP